MKLKIVGLRPAVTVSKICCSVNIWSSLHDLTILKPACSCRRALSTSTAFFILSNTMLAKIYRAPTAMYTVSNCSNCYSMQNQHAMGIIGRILWHCMPIAAFWQIAFFRQWNNNTISPVRLPDLVTESCEVWHCSFSILQ